MVQRTLEVITDPEILSIFQGTNEGTVTPVLDTMPMFLEIDETDRVSDMLAVFHDTLVADIEAMLQGTGEINHACSKVITVFQGTDELTHVSNKVAMF